MTTTTDSDVFSTGCEPKPTTIDSDAISTGPEPEPTATESEVISTGPERRPSRGFRMRERIERIVSSNYIPFKTSTGSDEREDVPSHRAQNKTWGICGIGIYLLVNLPIAIAILAMIGVFFLVFAFLNSIPKWLLAPIQYLFWITSAAGGLWSKIPSVPWSLVGSGTQPPAPRTHSNLSDLSAEVMLPWTVNNEPPATAYFGLQEDIFQKLTAIIPDAFAVPKAIGQLEISAFTLVGSIDTSDLPCKLPLRAALIDFITTTKINGPLTFKWVAEINIKLNEINQKLSPLKIRYDLYLDNIIDDGRQIMAEMNRIQQSLLDINRLAYEGCTNSSELAPADPVAWLWTKLGWPGASGKDHHTIIEKTRFFHDVGQARVASILQIMVAMTTTATITIPQDLRHDSRMEQFEIKNAMAKFSSPEL